MVHTVATLNHVPHPPSLNLGELIRGGTTLTTREVLAVAHEACRDPGNFPRSPDDLWLTDDGEIVTRRADGADEPIDPRSGVAAMLEAMLPHEASDDPARLVPLSLRGLPSRLRAPGRRLDLGDLMAVVRWHSGGDPRQIVRELADRVRHLQPQQTERVIVATPLNALDLFTQEQPSAPVADVAPSRARRLVVPRAAAVLGAAIVLAGIATASYRLFQQDEPTAPGQSPDAALPTSSLDPSRAAPRADAPDPSTANERDAIGTTEGEPIVAAEGAFSPAFTPDGRKLFFHAGRVGTGRLLIADLERGGPVTQVNAVFEGRSRNYHPRVSPDGRLLAFDSDREGERAVYVVERDGTEVQRVSGDGYAAVPSWSPDMKWLAFIRGEPRRPRVWNLWLRDLESGALQRHTSYRSGQVWGASWFPDGRSFCFSHEQQLVISHLDARPDVVIETPRPGHLVRTPAVSPDGTSVVFQVFRDGVWLLDVRSREMRRILDDPTAEEFAWSPDGRRIAYHSRRDGAWKIWMHDMEPATRAERQ